MRPVTVTAAVAKSLAQAVAVGPHRLASDVGPADGGDDAGPTPHEYLAAALAACTAMTMQMVAHRKGWPLTGVAVTVDVSHPAADAPAPGGTGAGAQARPSGDAVAAVRSYHTVLTRHIVLPAELAPERRARLLAVADACPIHRALCGKIDILTVVREEAGG